MRIIRELVYEECKVTLFHWNGKYIIKVELGNLEQTFKVPEFDVTGEESVNKLLDHDFMKKVILRFEEMQKSLTETIRRNE